ncbi:MAG TPA: hypothetical protein VLT45_15705, partial [Kofleriaceae bacterium]|nr:hypothetical protein [Kofleriaceae bacterium]
RRLSRAVLVSALLHVVAAIVLWLVAKPAAPEPEVVDIELAPPPPQAEALPEEVARPPSTDPGAGAHDEPTPSEPTATHDDSEGAPVDAGIDAPVDAAIDAAPRKRPDAAVDAAVDAATQIAEGSGETGSNVGSNAGSNDLAGSDRLGSAGSNQLALAAGSGGSGAGSGARGSGAGSGSNELASSVGSGAGSGSGVAAAVAMGSGSGVAGMDSQPAVEGAATTAGTAANLLSYFPPGHVVTALVRFDRLRGTEWAQPAEQLFHPMPDYRALFGTVDAGIADKLDMLVISTPRPRDALATTLVAKTRLSRREMRDLLATTGATWSATRAGMLGKRKVTLQGDKRVVLSPWKNWFVLASPDDLGALPAGGGSIDGVETRVKLPTWLAQIRTIEKESGEDKPGPALVATLTFDGTRIAIPDVGIGVTSLPAPTRLSLAMELVAQGWLVRGNIVFTNEADAAEFEHALLDVQKRVVGSFVISRLLKRQHVLNLVSGLSIARSGARVSYATSISIGDARALLAALAQMLADYFGQ